MQDAAGSTSIDDFGDGLEVDSFASEPDPAWVTVECEVPNVVFGVLFLQPFVEVVIELVERPDVFVNELDLLLMCEELKDGMHR